jgi:hypothetical protein
MDDLEKAIQLTRQAVEGTPKDYPDLVTCLNSLGNMLLLRYERTGKIDDIKEAI